MQHIKTLLVCMTATLLFSCSKKDEEKPVTPPIEKKKTYWTINGRKLMPTKLERKDKSILFSVYQADTVYAEWYLSFEKSISEGSYLIGGLSDRKQVYLFAEIRSANVDSVYDSRDYETENVKVSYTADDKAIIEVPEIWLINRNKPNDSCKFSGIFIEE